MVLSTVEFSRICRGDMETVPGCLLCGHNGARVRFHGRDRMVASAGEFTLVECIRCGFLYLSPRPDALEIERYYPKDYLCFSTPLYEETSRFRRFDRLNGLRKRCNLITRRKVGGRLLDVGCATGDFLSVMRALPQWDVCGLELDSSAAQEARRAYNLTVDVGTLDDVPYGSDSFDVVTMWDVLEHLPQPTDALKTIHRLLKADGLVVCGVPNRDSFDARIFGPYWAGLDVPRHCSVFSKNDVLKVLDQSGFQYPEVTFLGGSAHSFLLSARFWIKDLQTSSMVRKLALRVLGSPLTRVALLPYLTCGRLLGRGATTIAIARKV